MRRRSKVSRWWRLVEEPPCMSIVPTNINNYLRQFAYQLEERILQQFPPLHHPDEPLPAELARLRRSPYPAQALAIAGISKRWEVERSAGAIAECGTGKTLISLGAMFVHSGGKPFTTLVMAPPRSEEHTSELQSLRHLVCRLLLEKKKMNIMTPCFCFLVALHSLGHTPILPP